MIQNNTQHKRNTASDVLTKSDLSNNLGTFKGMSFNVRRIGNLPRKLKQQKNISLIISTVAQSSKADLAKHLFYT